MPAVEIAPPAVWPLPTALEAKEGRAGVQACTFAGQQQVAKKKQQPKQNCSSGSVQQTKTSNPLSVKTKQEKNVHTHARTHAE